VDISFTPRFSEVVAESVGLLEAVSTAFELKPLKRLARIDARETPR